jgi:hypothetical protein
MLGSGEPPNDPRELNVLLVRAIGDENVIEVTLEIECLRTIFLDVELFFTSFPLISFTIL